MLRDYVELILIFAVICAAMVLSPHLDARADKHASAPAVAAQDKRDIAARRACPADYESAWLDSSTNQCLRVLP